MDNNVIIILLHYIIYVVECKVFNFYLSNALPQSTGAYLTWRAPTPLIALRRVSLPVRCRCAPWRRCGYSHCWAARTRQTAPRPALRRVLTPGGGCTLWEGSSS